MIQRIAIYNGEGSSPVPLPGILLSANDLIETNWDRTCDLFIMPGGRDRPYHAALQGKGNRKIRFFVENGGTYLGICAGAYYGSARIEFDKDSPLEICEERELAFFSGTAVGPSYGKGTFDYASRSGVRAAKLSTPQNTFSAYYNGGCTFQGDLSRCRILARFADLPGHPPAIIECRVGKGKAILSGVHLEIPAATLDPSDPFLAPLIPILEASERLRSIFWNRILKKFL